MAAQDPDEFQEPSVGPLGAPCIVGRTARGSLPTIDPAGSPAGQAEKVWAILPFFDRNRNGVLDVFDPTVTGPASPTPVQCPEPGPPLTQHVGPFGTCTFHPSTLHAEPVVGSLLAGVSPPGPHIPLPNHSHIVRDGAVEIEPVWWQVISVGVDDERIWPDFNDRCPANPAGGPPCLTSVQALEVRSGEKSGRSRHDLFRTLFRSGLCVRARTGALLTASLHIPSPVGVLDNMSIILGHCVLLKQVGNSFGCPPSLWCLCHLSSTRQVSFTPFRYAPPTFAASL